MACSKPNTPCKLYYDSASTVEPGHFLATAAGSGYLVLSVRQDIKRPDRQHLSCLRLPVSEIPVEATVHPLVWYVRAKKPARRREEIAAAPASGAARRQ